MRQAKGPQFIRFFKPVIEVLKESGGSGTAAEIKYVREIMNESYKGEPEEITGYVTRLYPNRLLADVKLEPGRYVKVGLNEDGFRFVRYETGPEEQLRFKGCPIIRLGKDITNYQEFDADMVERDETT